MRKLDYQKRASQILDQSKPYNTKVKQRGCFDSFRKTYGCDRDFQQKLNLKADKPLFGPFKIGNLPKNGYNRTIGGNLPYMEDPLEDEITYKKDVRNPIWRDPTCSTSTAFAPMSRTFKNTNGQPMYK